MLITKVSISEANGIITIDEKDYVGDMVTRHCQRVVNLCEVITREKLIELGWTPPQKETPDLADRG